MDPGDSQRPALQGTDRPHHRPRQYHRDRHRVLPLSPYHGEAQGQNHGYEDLIPRRRAAGESNDLCNGSLKLWRAIKERRGWAKSEYQSGPSCIVKIKGPPRVTSWARSSIRSSPVRYTLLSKGESTPPWGTPFVPVTLTSSCN